MHMTCVLGDISALYIFKFSMHNRIFNVSPIQYVKES